MAKRLISLSELDEIEGLVEHHRKVQERIEAAEADAVQFHIPVQGTLELIGDAAGEFKIVDAKPLPVAKGKRAEWAKCLEASGQAREVPLCPRSKGFSTIGMVYGFKLHALVNEQGLFEHWSFAPAHHHEAALVPELTEGISGEIIGDKAYLGHNIITPKRKNMTEPSHWNNTLKRLRKRIETSFSVLVGSLTLHAAQVKTFSSLRARVNLKIAVHNLVHPGLLFG